MTDFLYLIFISPIEYVLDTIFCLLFRTFHRNGLLTIFYISMIVSFMALPFYTFADKLADSVRTKKEKMMKWNKHIHDTFYGDERMLMTARYYRMMSYNPLQELQGSFSIVLQIPFFVAAYHFLSNLEIIKGMGQWIFSDLGAPDALFNIGEIRINVLPVFMTIVNIISVFVYNKNGKLKDKIQAIVLAIFFLVLLYNSPSGLVLYWLFNNLFSLGKNIVIQYFHRRELTAGVCIFILGLGLRNAVSIAAAGPFVYFIMKNRMEKYMERKGVKHDKTTIFLLLSTLFLFMGIIIPTFVIASSPVDFINIFNYRNPLWYALKTACVYLGLFIIFGGLWWKVSSAPGRYLMEVFMIIIIIHNISMYFLNSNVGVLNTLLVLENPPELNMDNMPIGILVIGVSIAVGVYISERRNLLNVILRALCISFLCISVLNVVRIVKVIDRLDVIDENKDSAELEAVIEPVIPLSREGKNVVILMMDKALGQLFPYILQEKPELKHKLDGFIFYPNTLSAAGHTNLASPAVFGGYEYLPEAMEKDESRSVQDKIDEALKMLPKLFVQNGYTVDIYDSPYAGGGESMDVTIFNDIQGATGHILNGRYNKYCFPEDSDESAEHNFVMYSVYSTVSIWSQIVVYDGGAYLSSSYLNTDLVSWAQGKTAATNAFKGAYSTMKLLPELTDITSDDVGNIIIMSNQLTHEPRVLQLPEYLPEDEIDNSAYKWDSRRDIDGIKLDMSDSGQMAYYHVNMAAIMLIGDWCDYLRRMGVYDNTRIIVVADHGAPVEFLNVGIFEDGLNVGRFNPLLLVKDFKAKGFETDRSFMCNADVPYIAIEGLTNDMHNPYTGQILDNTEKKNGIVVVESMNHTITGATIGKNGHAFDTSDGRWWRVKDDIYDHDKWTVIRYIR